MQKHKCFLVIGFLLSWAAETYLTNPRNIESYSSPFSYPAIAFGIGGLVAAVICTVNSVKQKSVWKTILSLVAAVGCLLVILFISGNSFSIND
jgi:hypothetical protein